MARAAGDAHLLARTLTCRAAFAGECGDWHAAFADYEESLAIARRRLPDGCNAEQPRARSSRFRRSSICSSAP
jgi:hypothetical protein